MQAKKRSADSTAKLAELEARNAQLEEELANLKREQSMLRRDADRLRSIMQYAPFAISLKDLDGRFFMSSRFLANHFGMAESIEGKTVFDILPKHLAESHSRHDHETAATRQPIQRDYEVATDDTVRNYLTSKFPVFGRDGKVEAICSVSSDITDRKQAEKEIAELNQELTQHIKELQETQSLLMRQERLAALGQLIATVSHELRNPLGAIRTSTAVIDKLMSDPDPRIQDSLDIVNRNIMRCDKIITDLFDYTREQQPACEAALSHVWLEGLLDEYPLPEGVELRRQLNCRQKVVFDPEQLRRVMVNLLDNACQALTTESAPHRAEGVLTVKSSVSAGRWVLEVSDTGRGIKSEHRDQIFEPLFSTKTFGVGLGLTVVKRVVDDHDGTFEVISHEGRGTTMTLSLPTGLAEKAQ